MSDGVSSTWIYYVDESYDEEKFCLTALGVKVGTWRAAFDAVKQYRIGLKQTDGVLLRTEIHAESLPEDVGVSVRRSSVNGGVPASFSRCSS
jgi:hypothetical protein